MLFPVHIKWSNGINQRALRTTASCNCREEEEEEDDEEYEDGDEEEGEDDEEGEEPAADKAEAAEGVDEAAAGEEGDDDNDDYTDLSKGTFFCADVKANGLPVGPGVPTEVHFCCLM